MRIVVHDYAAYPFTAQLARSLAGRGHDVLYLHGGGIRTSRAQLDPRTSDSSTLRVEAVPIVETLHARAGLRRLRQERRYGRALAARVKEYRPDVVLSVPSSLDAQAAVQAAAHESGSAFVFWLQDIYSQAILRLLGKRVPLAGKLIAARFERLERTLLASSDAVVAITEDFVPILEQWDVAPDRIVVEPNWAPLDELDVLPQRNPWSESHGFADVRVLLYAGTLGRKHDPSLLVSLADALPDAVLVVVAEGAGAERLRQLRPQRQNLVLMPLQPAEQLSAVLATADILLAILDPDANVFSVPSKVLTYLAAGRPILAAIPSVNLAARTILAADAGRVVEPTDRAGWVAAAAALLADDDARMAAGTAGREYSERSFDIGTITDRLEAVLADAAQAARRIERRVGA
jgi:glycosyltransferase involved in cell wall biosynthesis